MNQEKIIIWLDNLIEFSLCAIIFTLPFSKAIVEIYFVFALACWITKRIAKFRFQNSLTKIFNPVETKLNLPIAVFIFVGFLSMLTSVSFLLSLEGFFFKLFEWIMIYFIVVEIINSKKRLKRILLVMLSSVALIAMNGLFQFVRGVDFIRHFTIIGNKIRSSFGNPNSFAAWLVVMVPTALSLAYFRNNARFNLSNKDSWLRSIVIILLWILTAILIFCLVLTYSIGAWISVLLSLIFLGICSGKKLLVIIITALLIFSFVTISMREYANLIAENSEMIRINLWGEALGIVEDFPLLGCGLNTYATVGRKYKITDETGFYPHNSYLHMAAESGLLGLGAFIWIIVTLFTSSIANFRNINSGANSNLLIGLLAGLFGFLVHSFVDINFYSLQLGNLMWFIMGLIVAIQKIALDGKG